MGENNRWRPNDRNGEHYYTAAAAAAGGAGGREEERKGGRERGRTGIARCSIGGWGSRGESERGA